MRKLELHGSLKSNVSGGTLPLHVQRSDSFDMQENLPSPTLQVSPHDDIDTTGVSDSACRATRHAAVVYVGIGAHGLVKYAQAGWANYF